MTKTTPEWEVRFKSIWYGGVTVYYNDVTNFIQEQIDLAYKKGVEEENLAWRKALRCEVCGISKPNNLSTMCINCLEDR